MSAEAVAIQAAGVPYAGWQTVEVEAAINEVARKFTATTTEAPGEWSFVRGTPVEVRAGGDIVLAGYTNRYRARGNARTHGVSIVGRSRSQDILDCAAVHETGNWQGRTVLDIARELDRFGVGFSAAVTLAPLATWQLNPGETVFQTLERALRPSGLAMMGLADGSVEITDGSVAQRAGSDLQEGVDFTDYAVDLDDDKRHSHYTVIGQSRARTDGGGLRIKQTHVDTGVQRYRPKILVNETDTDDASALQRAANEGERAAGELTKAQVVVTGWRDAAGALWAPNRLVYVHSPTLLHLEQDMLVEKVRLHQDGKSKQSGGTRTTLHLVDPRTWRARQGKRAKADAAWQ